MAGLLGYVPADFRQVAIWESHPWYHPGEYAVLVDGQLIEEVVIADAINGYAKRLFHDPANPGNYATVTKGAKHNKRETFATFRVKGEVQIFKKVENEKA